MGILKVAWDDHYVRRNEGGTGVYGSSLLQQLNSRDDLQVNILDGWQTQVRKGFSNRALRVGRDLFWTNFALPRRLKKFEADVLHAPAFTAPPSAPCPVVITIHDITFLLYPSHFRRWWVTYLKIVLPRAVKSAAAVICVSEHAKKDIVRTYGIASDKVCVIHHGVDHDRFHPGARLDGGWAKKIGLRHPYLLHVGTLSSRKNIPTLLRAFARLRSQGNVPTHQLVLAGQESPGLAGADEIRESVRKLDLTDSVLFAGHVSDEKLPGLYAQAGALVMPSIYEGFGFPILESMAVGTPVISSNTSSLPEVAGDAALLVSPLDEEGLATALAEVLGNEVLADSLRRKGLARAQQFSWQRAASETIGLYQRVATGRRQQSPP